MEESIGAREVRLSFTGGALPLFGWTFLMAICEYLVIPAPWAAAALYRFAVRNTSFSDGTQVSFSGKGEDVWWVFMLVGLACYASFIPIPFIGLLLLPLTVWLWITVYRWFIRSIVMSCGTQLRFTGGYWEYLGWSLLIMVSVFTIIGWAWAMVAMMRWMCRNTGAKDLRVEFLGSGGQALWRTIVASLGCMFVIPIPWVTLWLVNWYVANLRVLRTQSREVVGEPIELSSL